MTKLTLIFCAMALTMIRINSEVVIKEFNTNGLLFQPLGNVYIYETTWKVISSLEMQNFQEEFKLLTEQLQQLTDFKSQIEQEQGNKFDLMTIEILIIEINKLIDTIGEINTILIEKENIHRNKRAILPIIGTVIEFLFGNPDEDTMKSQIIKLNSLKNENKQLEYLTLNQTLFTEKLVETIKQTNKKFNTEFNQLINQIMIIKVELKKEKLISSFLVNVQIMTISIIRYAKYQSHILDAVLQRQNIQLNPEIIPYSKLKSILEKIQLNLESTQMLPTEIILKNKKINLYKLITMTTKIIDDKIIFEIQIPILSRNKKNLYYIVSTPTPIGDKLYYIEPKTSFIITNKLQNEISYNLMNAN